MFYEADGGVMGCVCCREMAIGCLCEGSMLRYERAMALQDYYEADYAYDEWLERETGM